MAEIFQQGTDPALTDMVKKYILGQSMQTMQNQLPMSVDPVQDLLQKAAMTQGKPTAPTVEVRGKVPPSLEGQFLPPLPAVTQAAPGVAAPVGEPLAPVAEPAAAPVQSGEGWKFPSVPQEMLGGLLRTGLELMQPMPMWQSNTGHLARAAMAGVDYTNEQKKAEQASKVAEAQIAQTGAATEKTRADTKHTAASTEKLVQELEDTRSMHDLRIDELKGKIDLARKQGLLDDAQAKALGQKLEADPRYRGAVIDELQAKAFYYRNPQLRGGGDSSDPAVLAQVKARTENLIATGMEPQAASAQAWQERLSGATGAKDTIEAQNAARMLKILKIDYDEETAGNKKALPFNSWLKEKIAGAAIGDELNKLGPRIRELAMEQGQQAAQVLTPAAPAAPKAAPIPTKMGPNNAPVVDRTKLVPGTTYTLPNGQTYTHQGPAK